MLTGCSTGQGAKSEHDSSTYSGAEAKDSTQHPTTATPTVSPFDAYNLTPEQQSVLESAEAQLTKQCMQEAGFTYRTAGSGDDGAEPTEPQIYDPNWGPLDPQAAKKYGYDDPTSMTALLDGTSVDPAAGARVEIRETESTEDAAYQRALDGADGQPGDGCAEKAFKSLGRGPASAEWSAAIGAVERLRSTAGQAAVNDAAIDQAVERWASCMRERGYAYQSPQDAKSDTWERTPDKRELETASSDAECKRKVDLMGVLKRVQLDHEREAAAKNLPALRRVQYLNLQALKKADAVLSEGR